MKPDVTSKADEMYKKLMAEPLKESHVLDFPTLIEKDIPLESLNI